MSLQRRLTLFFILIVILPLAVAGFVVQRVVVGERARRAELSLGPVLDATSAVIRDQVDVLDERAQGALSDPRFGSLLQRARPEEIQAFLDDVLSRNEGLDFVIAMDRKGRRLGSSLRDAVFLDGFSPPTARAILQSPDGVGPGFARTRLPVEEATGEVGAVVAGFWLDSEVLTTSVREDIFLSLVVGDEVAASTAPIDSTLTVDLSYDATFDIDLGEKGTAEARSLADNVSLMSSTSEEPIAAVGRRILLSMLGLLALALLGTMLLAWLLARLITQPLEELTRGAHAIAEGRFDHRIEVRSRDEVGQLAVVFNEMTERLRDTITQLSSSRDQLHRAFRRVGETLRSTHDMKQMLDSILNTAADAVAADAATLWMFSPTRDEVYPVLGTGLEIADLRRMPVGAGLIGLVAERGNPAIVPSTGGPRPGRGEPEFPVAIAVPLYGQDRIMGVLSVYRRDSRRPFTQQDLDTVVFLVEQGGVAIENVLLHEEAQRLSLTDGLTGVWNRRYFQMQFRQILATAVRFRRPFSVLIMDLDHFKQINDTYGHQRGDAILVEFSQRVSHTLREVDTFARYGGEEFICLLSETDISGARIAAEKILEAIRSKPFGTLGEPLINLRVSIGVAAYPEHGDSFTMLIETADKALFKAKQQGRDQVCVADDPETPGNLRLAT